MLLAAWIATAAGTAQAREHTFRFPIRRELHAIDGKSGAATPYTRERIGDSIVPVLGVTGRVALSQRPMWVDEGGQLFIEATVPESLADRARELDVYVQDPRQDPAGKNLVLRGSIHYEPGRKPYQEPGTEAPDEDSYKPVVVAGNSRRVSRVFLFPDLPMGPVLTEVHLRGAQSKDWQQITTGAVEVPAGGRLHFGFALDGADPRHQVPVDLLVQAERIGGKEDSEKDPAVVTVYSRRVSGGGSGRWEAVDQELTKLAGKKYRFVFRSRSASADATGAPGVVWGAPSVEYDELRRSYPIVLVVSFDSLRTSTVGLYYETGATPFLSSFFGKDGAVMLQASTQAVTTLPAHMTMMTGLNPAVHGVIDETRSLASSIPTLAEAMHKEGWHTVAFTEGGALGAEFGFQRGFDFFDEGGASEVSPSSSDALQRAADWLQDYSGEPLFLFVHTYLTRPVHLGEDASDDSVRQSRIAAYVEQVRTADRSVKALFDVTKGRIVEDDSLYVVTSGHGEEFYEHGAAGHGTQLYEESLRVPLLLRGGRVEAGGRYDVPVGLVDLAPTILDLADADIPSGMQGKSFYKVVHSGRDLEMPSRFAEAHRRLRLLRDGSLLEWGAPSYSLREGSYKVIFHSGGDGEIEAYDLSLDRRERRNLAAERHPPDWVLRLGAVVRGYPALSAKAARQRPSTVELTPANRKRLESLGYAQ